MTVHTREELTAVAELAARRRVRVVVDEIHAPLVYPDARHLPYLSLPGTGDGQLVDEAGTAVPGQGRGTGGTLAAGAGGANRSGFEKRRPVSRH